MLSLVSASTAFQAPFVAPATGRAADVRMETVADLKALAEKCNPVVGFWCAAVPCPPCVTSGSEASRRPPRRPTGANHEYAPVLFSGTR